MSTSLVILLCAITLARCQLDYHRSSQNTAILQDSRYLSGDGTFGAAYTQEDGVEFKEESDVDGNRRGSYSYVDPTGQRRTVTYTAGVNGFQATGDHIPSQVPPTASPPEYIPLAQYNPLDYKLPQVQAQAQAPVRVPAYQLLQQSYKPQYDTQESVNEAQSLYRYPLASQPNRLLARLSAQPDLYQPRYVEYPIPQLRYESKYESATLSQYRMMPTRPTPPRYYYNELTTPVPKQFKPPGKLNFNRTPDGFSYTYSKNEGSNPPI